MRAWHLILWIFLVSMVAGCTVSEDAQCRSDDDCAAGQRCVGGGGVFVRDGACVDRQESTQPNQTQPNQTQPNQTPSNQIDPDDCADSEDFCSGQCVDLQLDTDHCGSCENVCTTSLSGAESLCTSGSCSVICAGPDEVPCTEFDLCANLSDDDEHCGSCGNLCAAGTACESGQCQPFCDEQAAPFGGGEGSEEDPFRICTASHLQAIDDHLAATFEMWADLDLSGHEFSPIGQGSYEEGTDEIEDAFEGRFDGGGHQITGLMLPSEPDLQGLFGIIGTQGQVHDVTIEGSIQDLGSDENGEYMGLVAGLNAGHIEEVSVAGDVQGVAQVGLVVGRNLGLVTDVLVLEGEALAEESAGGVAGTNTGEINNVSVGADVFIQGETNGEGLRFGGVVGFNAGLGIIAEAFSAARVEGESYLGGVVGESRGVVEDSEAASVEIRGNNHVGGAVGYLNGTVGANDRARVERVSARGELHAHGEGTERFGGLVGENRSGEIIQSFADVEVGIDTPIDALAGGLVGILQSGEISNSYAIGPTSASFGVGGLAGRSAGNAARIGNSFSAGMVEGDEEVGGFLGERLLGIFSNCFWNIDTSGTAQSSTGQGLTAQEFTQQASFPSFDFQSIWVMGDERPQLQWE